MGGGLLAESGSRPVLRRVVFRENRAAAGGAIAIGFAAVARLEHCRAEANVSHGTAGAFEVHDGGELFLRDCLMRGNSGGSGGALGIAAGRIEAEACTLLVNQADFGGAACAMSGALILRDCRAGGNSATMSGGAVMLTSSAAHLSSCAIDSNLAAAGGGAVYAYDSTVEITDCLLTRNDAGSSPDSRGGGVSCSSSELAMERCTLAANHGLPGAGVWTDGEAPVTLDRSILALGLGGAAVQGPPGANASASCCDVWGNHDGDWVGLLLGQEGLNGNICLDPQFCGEENAGLPWSIADSSPCAPAPSGECQGIGSGPIGCGASSIEGNGPFAWVSGDRPAGDPSPPLPRQVRIVSVFPNPCLDVTTIQVRVGFAPDSHRADSQTITIHDLAGRTIRTLSCRLRPRDEEWEAEVHWNGCDEHGRLAPAGIYWIEAVGDADGAARCAREIFLVRP